VQEIAGLESLVKGLLKKNEDHRLGFDSGGYAKLKKHEFFSGFEWDKLEAGELDAPIKPAADKMNAPNTVEMDMKKIKEYEHQRADEDDIERSPFGANLKKWDHVCDTTSVPKAYVDYLERGCIEVAKLPPGSATLYSTISSLNSTDVIEDIANQALPKNIGAPPLAGGSGGEGGGGGCCVLM